MEFERSMPVSPNGQYLNSSVLSVCAIAVLELEDSIDDLPMVAFIENVFLPVNPRFSSIMITDEIGTRKWERVQVNLLNHVKYPRFPSGLSPTSYDEYFNEYLTDIGLEELPQNQPLWEVHVVTYPTSTSAGSVIFKLHHALGDGYSLMGTLLSCLQRADDPSLPLRFPSRVSQSNENKNKNNNKNKNMLLPKLFSLVYNTISDFGLSLLKSTVVEDDSSPIRSGNPLVQYLPKTHTNITFSLDQIQEIKSNLGHGVTIMEFERSMPVSPNGQYLNSSVLSVCAIAVLELEDSIDDLPMVAFIENVFLPVNPRFSSIMITDEIGTRKWERVQVNLLNHVKYPRFPSGLSPTSYDEYFNEYLTDIGLEELPQNQPLWEVHVVTYPTSTSAGSVIFKLHHALGDGYSLMGTLLSCLQRADDPSLPLRFPSRVSQSNENKNKNNNKNKNMLLPKLFSLVYNTISDFGLSLLKSTVVEDDSSPIRSGNPLVQYLPKTHTNITFSLDQIQEIKSNLGHGVTVNDVIAGVIFMGTRLYMKSISDESSKKSFTGLVLLNTRMSVGYKTVGEMLKPTDGSKPLWGNQFAFLHINVPEFGDLDSLRPHDFMRKVNQILESKKTSLGFVLTAKLVEFIRKICGPEVAAKLVYNTLNNSSIVMSNIIGPTEQVALDNRPISSMYFTVSGVPESLLFGIVSYMGKVRITIACEKGFIVPHKYKACVEHAFKLILKPETQAK